MTEIPCQEMHLLVQAELDGELDAAGAAMLAMHVQSCTGCAGLRGELGALSGRLRNGLTRHTAPPALRRAVMPPAALPQRPPLRWRPMLWRHAVSFGAGMVLAASVAGLFIPRPGLDPFGSIVAAHIRALQPGHLVDVASTDQHTVKPWFDGRLDFAPPVGDFAAQGFPLVGGRLDYLDGRPVAALVYRRDRHLIDVFIWPGAQTAASGAVQGYNVVAWSQGGMNFRAVSDLNTAELSALAALLRR